MPLATTETPSASSQSQDAQFRVVRKRNRIPLSCAPCRHRKLGCDRTLPCDNCTRRGDADACAYAVPNAHKRNPVKKASYGDPEEMQSRIDRLEHLVLSFITNGAESAAESNTTAAFSGSATKARGSAISNPTSFSPDLDQVAGSGEEPTQSGDADKDDDLDQITKSVGTLNLDHNMVFFVPESHWYSVVSEIEEVKNWFKEHKRQHENNVRQIKANTPDDERSELGFLFLAERPASRAEILREFPPRNVCDILMARFFNSYSYDPSFYIIHAPTFRKQYDAYWQNSAEMPVIWIGMAYAMMVIALRLYEADGEEPAEFRGQAGQMIRDYRRLTAQSIILAKINQPHHYMVETLLLYLLGEFGRSNDIELGVLYGVSVLVRVATVMGYHRDSKSFPRITPFMGEMRRRVWCAVREADLLFSSQIGMRPILRFNDIDTELPSNLYDTELHEDMRPLPPSRSMTEPTPISYLIYKSQLLSVLGQIVEKVHKLCGSAYEKVMKLDQKLCETRANIPPHLKMRTMAESRGDPPQLIMQRYILDLLFLRSQCVLHRKFLHLSRENPKPSYSRRVAIDASMQILQHQATLHNESQSGGGLSGLKLFYSSVAAYDFLSAAMIACLVLYAADRAESRNHSDDHDLSQEKKASMMAALERSRAIWWALQSQSHEAFKGYGMLSAMLTVLRNREAQRSHPDSVTQDATDMPRTDVVSENSGCFELEHSDTAMIPASNMEDFSSWLEVGQPATFPGYSAGVPAESAPQRSTLSTPKSDSVVRSPASNNGPVDIVSPFRAFWSPGMGLGLQHMDSSIANIDWEAWDSCGGNMWPMNVGGLMDRGGVLPTTYAEETELTTMASQECSNT